MTMPVAVMQVRIMRVLVSHGFVPVRMRVRLGDRSLMTMLMMLVMYMVVVVLQSLMVVYVIESLRQVQP